MAKHSPSKRPAAAARGKKAARDTARLKDSIVKAMKRIDKHDADIADSVRRSVSGTLRATGVMAKDMVEVVGDVVTGVAVGSAAAGTTGTLVAVKAVSKGAVLGVADVGGDIVGAAAATARAAVQVASSRSADIGMVVQQALRGVAEAAAELGENAGKLAEAGAKGAIEAAATLGTTAADAAHKVLGSLSEGVTSVLRTIVPAATQPKSNGDGRRVLKRHAARRPSEAAVAKTPARRTSNRPRRKAGTKAPARS